MSFVAELKRRNVIRMAGLYLVAAWLLIQVAETLLPAFDVPGWVLRAVIILLALGFIPALMFSWVFEMTPDGIKRDTDVAPDQSIAPQTARRMDRLIMAVLALALGFFGFDRLVLDPRRDAALVATTTKTVEAKATAAASATPKIDRNSIAVLPFVNMSGEAANEYFSDGISEEILNVLAGAPELKVAARTSSFSFKGKAAEVPEIARVLKVRMVLEGSVRKQGDQVRITAQLIDADSGFHLWSETYDRKLEDIFAIQDEIANAIGDALKVKIRGAEAGDGVGGNGNGNVAAYDLFLRGMALWHTRREQALWDAVEVFEQAVAIDPGFAQAYAGLAIAFAIIGDYSTRLPYDETLRRARDFAERALALDPALPEAYAASSMVAAKEFRRDTAAALLDRAIALRPSFATAHQWKGNLLMTNGDFAGGLASHEKASELDPRALVVSENHAIALRMLGRDAEAKARCQQTLAFAPNYSGCIGDVAMTELQLGNLAEARAALERVAAIDNPSASAQGSQLVAALEGKGDRRALATRYAALPHNSRFDPGSGNAIEGYDMPSMLMLLGEPGLALDYVERLAAEVGGTADWAVMFPQMDPIRCDPRFVAVVKKLKTTDPHYARVCEGKR